MQGCLAQVLQLAGCALAPGAAGPSLAAEVRALVVEAARSQNTPCAHDLLQQKLLEQRDAVQLSAGQRLRLAVNAAVELGALTVSFEQFGAQREHRVSVSAASKRTPVC